MAAEYSRPTEDESEEQGIAFEYDELSANLVDEFMDHPDGQEALKKLCNRIDSEFDAAWEATGEYRDRMAADWSLFSGELPPKQAPFQYSANAHVPLMLETLTRVHARAKSELFGDWSHVFGVLPLGPMDEDTAAILTEHGNWQVRNQIPDFKRQIGERGLLAFFVHGDVAAHSYWDTKRQQNRHEVLMPDEFVTPYVYTTTMPDFSDVPWVCKILHLHRHELEAKKGIWSGVDEVLDKKPSFDDEPAHELSEEVNRIQGKEMTEDSDTAPYKILHWEGWGSLPNQTEERYLQVIIDKRTKRILSLSIHEQENWQDVQRYQRQIAELEGYRQNKAQHEAMLLQMQQGMEELSGQAEQAEQLGEQAVIGPMQEAQVRVGITEQLTQAQRQLEMMQSQAPVAPEWIEDGDPDDPELAPEPPRREPLHLFSHEVCIEPLVGSLGLGFGRMQADHNRATNVLLSQFVDSATAANAPSFLADANFDVEGGLEISPLKINKVTGLSGGEISKSMMPLDVKPANPQLIEILSRIYEWGQSSIQAPGVLSGEPGKSGETYRGLSARIEQATKQISVPTRKYADFVTQVLKNNAWLNATFLPDEEIFQIANHVLGQTQDMKVTREMYSRDYRVEIRADLRFISTAQKIQEADAVLQMAMGVPILAQNPIFLYHAVRRSLEARGRRDMIQYMGPEPQPPAPPGPEATAPGAQGPGASPQGQPPQQPGMEMMQ